MGRLQGHAPKVLKGPHSYFAAALVQRPQMVHAGKPTAAEVTPVVT